MAVPHQGLKFIGNGPPFADANLLLWMTYLKDSKSKVLVEKGTGLVVSRCAAVKIRITPPGVEAIFCGVIFHDA